MRVIIIAFLLIAIASLTACAETFSACIHCENTARYNLPPAMEHAGGNPVRGIWDGNVFISEYLGLWFYLPEGWTARTDEQLVTWRRHNAEIAMPAEGSAIATSFFNIGAPLGNSVRDMYVRCNISSTSVIIEFHLEVWGRSTPERLEDFKNLANHMSVPFIICQYQIRLGGLDWYSNREIYTFGGSTFHSRHLMNDWDGFIAEIMISSSYSASVIDDIMQMFGCLNTIPISANISQ